MQDQEVSIKNVLSLVGIQAAPTGAPTVATHSGTTLGIGLYCYQYTWVSADGGETVGSPNGNVTTTSNNQAANLSSITVGPTGTVARNIYRTKVGCAGGAKLFFVAQIADNSTTTYLDTVSDASLGTTILPITPTFGGALFVKNPAGTVLAKINNDGRFDPAGITSVVSGSVGGTATLWIPVWGAGLKIVIVNETSYNSANVANFILPQPATTLGIMFLINSTNTVSVLSNGTAGNIQLITSLGTASASGGSAGTTVMHANSMGMFGITDTLQLSGTGGLADNATIVMIGF